MTAKRCGKGKRKNAQGLCINAKGKIKNYRVGRNDMYTFDLGATSQKEADRLANEEDYCLNAGSYAGSEFTVDED